MEDIQHIIVVSISMVSIDSLLHGYITVGIKHNTNNNVVLKNLYFRNLFCVEKHFTIFMLICKLNKDDL